jgi:hypothetical protein
MKRLVSPTKIIYQAKVGIKVWAHGNLRWGMDQITLNFDPPYPSHQVKDISAKAKIELVEYKQITPIPK